MRRFAMDRIIAFIAAVILLASAEKGHAAFQGKKPDKQDPPIASGGNNAAAGDETKPMATPATTDPAYVIGPEDVLDISVWKEPDVSRVVPVRPDGRISLPLVNDVQAAGLSPQQLAATLTERLRKFMNEPQVTVIVTAINSQRVFVVG